MEAESSLPCIQEPVTYPFSEPCEIISVTELNY